MTPVTEDAAIDSPHPLHHTIWYPQKSADAAPVDRHPLLMIPWCRQSSLSFERQKEREKECRWLMSEKGRWGWRGKREGNNRASGHEFSGASFPGKEQRLAKSVCRRSPREYPLFSHDGREKRKEESTSLVNESSGRKEREKRNRAMLMEQ